MNIYSHPIFYKHDTGVGHPETATRMDHAIEGVRRAGLENDVTQGSVSIETDRIIVKVHSGEYAEAFEDACRTGYRLFHSLDNSISRASYSAARTAVGTSLDAATAIWETHEIDRAFVIARPPGHHAERVEAMGFCFFNTIACVAERLLELYDVKKVFIFDWDVHHGNGTQHLFEDREDVFYASMHRYPFYPGTGAENEVGIGRGEGYTRNIPLEEGEGDATYLAAVENVIVPLIDQYQPDAILLSSGFDAHRRDPLGGMSVTEGAFGEMTRRIVEAANKHCHGRILSLLEGGYDPEGIAASVAEHLAVLAGRN